MSEETKPTPGPTALWDAIDTPPEWALKKIQGGRMSGKTDINPMWRLRAITEQFGICGLGWKYTIDRQWTEPGADGQVCVFCNVSLYIKDNEMGEWSAPIPGTGGNMLVEKEHAGLHTSDEAYKMAMTDALSVAFKALGMAAQIYYGTDRTKYQKGGEAEDERPPAPGTGTRRRPATPAKPEASPPVAGAAEAAESSYKKYLAAMADMRSRLGDVGYYRVLGAEGYEHANEIKVRKDQEKAFQALRQALAEKVAATRVDG